MNFLKKLFSQFKQSKQGVCFLCDEIFPESSLKECDDMVFCSKHHQVYLDNNWICGDTIQYTTDQEDHKKALYHQNLKERLIFDNIPTYITVDYKHEAEIISSVSKIYVPEKYLVQIQKVIKDCPILKS